MAIEIERKFLLKEDLPLSLLKEGVVYVQAYLNKDPERTVRVRVAGEKAFLTIKGKTSNASRLEFEYEIPVKEAWDLMSLAVLPPIYKKRYQVKYASHTWEIDVFEKENEGLIVAEIELESIDEMVDFPLWIGEEVTGDVRYYNLCLAEKPYSKW